MESLTREEKEQRWQKMAMRMDRMADGLGMPIDTGIKDTVIVLNLLGFPTSMSCEGHAYRGVHGPWVDIKPNHLDQIEKKWKKKQIKPLLLPSRKSVLSQRDSTKPRIRRRRNSIRQCYNWQPG